MPSKRKPHTTGQPARKPAARKPATRRPAARKPAAAPLAARADSLRVRMYRVGFGDFFLLTVPSSAGPQHILIDCGVTSGKTGKGDIRTITGAVADMAEATGRKLALLIVTHRHKDHVIGFSRCAKEFEQFEIDAIWMSGWEDQYKKEVVELQADLAAVARDVQLHLALRAGDDADTGEMLGMLENALGFSASEGPERGTNAKTVHFIKTGLGTTPDYYVKGQKPELPDSLVRAGLSAEILGPPPLDKFDFVKLENLRKGVGQYLAARSPSSRREARRERTSRGKAARDQAQTFTPFAPEWRVEAKDYPKEAFREWAPRERGKVPNFDDVRPEALEEAVRAVQPDVLAIAVKTLDDLLNNQSLVVLFTWKKKKLLFAGDAQAGNWDYWLFDSDTPTRTGRDVELTREGAEILSEIDFYKVGHHGSTNATPIPAVEAMGDGFVAMCSTQAHSFGDAENGSEVPRVPLLEALSAKCTLVRSDQIEVDIHGVSVPAVDDAPAELPTPKRGRFEQGPCYIDYWL